jgi:hypothetical protein
VRPASSQGVARSQRRPEHFRQPHLEATQIEQGRTREGTHEKIKMAVVKVGTVQSGSEDAHVGGAKSLCHFANGRMLLVDGGRGFEDASP